MGLNYIKVARGVVWLFMGIVVFPPVAFANEESHVAEALVDEFLETHKLNTVSVLSESVINLESLESLESCLANN